MNNSENNQLVQSIIDQEIDFLQAVERLNSADFSETQWKNLTIGLMEDRVMRIAGFQYQQSAASETTGVSPSQSDDNEIRESLGNSVGVDEARESRDDSVLYKENLKHNENRAAHHWIYSIAATVLFSFLAFSVGWSLNSPEAIQTAKGKNDPSLQKDASHFAIGGSQEERVPGNSESPINLVNYPVDLEQLERSGRFDRSDIEDAFITRDQRRSLRQSGFMVDELVGTTVLSVSPDEKQPVATRLICVRYVGELTIQ